MTSLSIDSPLPQADVRRNEAVQDKESVETSRGSPKRQTTYLILTLGSHSVAWKSKLGN